MENFVLGLILGGVIALLVYSATSNSSLPIPTMNIEEDEASNEELIEPKVYKEKYLEW